MLTPISAIAFHERAVSATAALVNLSDVNEINPNNPPQVTHVDPDGIAHVNYAFSGPGKKLLVCLGTARALKVQSVIDRQVPLREP